MTARVKELAKKAGLLNRRFMFGQYYEDELTDEQKKFAELIVQECIDVVLNSDPSPKMIAHEPYRTIMNNIVEHFGVDE